MNATSCPPADLAARLHELYHDASKHAVYQSVPAFVARALGYQEEIHSLWRSDTPRYEYILERMALPPGAAIADIGANTGFFTLNLAQARPGLRVTAYEMNPRHAEFIRLTAAAFSLDVNVLSQSCDFDGVRELPRFDAILLLNVLHHAGFDFDRELADDNDAFTRYAIAYLQRLRGHARQLVFQIGSNRGGDKARPLFPRDDDTARLGWIGRVLREAGWRASCLAYAQLAENAVVFRDAPTTVLHALQSGVPRDADAQSYFAAAGLHRFPGEFHRRPLIIASAV